eukprot:jgi/Ulvmu1/6086/UM027_0064.1
MSQRCQRSDYTVPVCLAGLLTLRHTGIPHSKHAKAYQLLANDRMDEYRIGLSARRVWEGEQLLCQKELVWQHAGTGLLWPAQCIHLQRGRRMRFKLSCAACIF